MLVSRDVRLNTTHFFIMKILKGKRFNKSFCIIHLLWTPKTPWSYTENVLKNREEKLQYDINTVAAKISVWPSGKIDKDDYLTCEKVLSTQQQRLIEVTKCSYSRLRKAFENQTKII